MRPLWPAGLRWRLLLALVATSAVSLGIAALVVLPPLQGRLRDQSADGLRTSVEATKARFETEFDRLDRRRQPATPLEYESPLATPSNDLNAQTGARVLVADDTGVPSSPADTAPGFLSDSESFLPVPEGAMRLALRTGREMQTVTAIDGDGDGVLVATPLLTPRGALTGMLVAERELTQATTLVGQVRDRFLIAAVVGLTVAVLLAVALSSTLLRRLARLRGVAVRITEQGPDATTPHDDRRDEVGDLGRALARMQEELRRQEAARRAFVSTASHELRTPLTMLQGTMELLEEDLRTGRLDEADALHHVASARHELDRMTALSGELLDLSRLDAAVPLRSEPVELGELARAVCAEFALRAEGRATRIELVPPAEPCWGRGDPDAIARVVRILIDNALRYGPVGRPVRVAVDVAPDAATLTVSDTGPGIPPEERETIFERFHRGARAGGAGGFGLGLAIGRELARRMGGELALAEGEGTRFALRLRAARSPLDAGASPGPGAPERVSA